MSSSLTGLAGPALAALLILGALRSFFFLQLGSGLTDNCTSKRTGAVVQMFFSSPFDHIDLVVNYYEVECYTQLEN